MPELPEVETIKKGLEKAIVGKKIEKFESKDSKVVQFKSEEIEGLYINNISRRAKILIFYLSEKKNVIPAKAGIQDWIPDQVGDDTTGKLMLVHLKMTGQLIWEACVGGTEFCLKKIKSPSTTLSSSLSGEALASEPNGRTTQRVAGGHPSPDWVAKLPNNYTRAIFHFDDKSVLFFNDLRRFGYVKLYDTKNVIPAKAGIQKNTILDPRVKPEDDKLVPELAKLGPDPFSPEFTVEYMMLRASKIPNRKIKQFITDQEIIAGVGNIYVDEALFYAGILPTRLVKDIKLSEWKKIKDSIIKALELGLKYGGSSEDTYVDAFGNQGTMNQHTMVYRKTGQSCQREDCKGIIKRISLGGRGTHFCPECQK